jgi:cytochrome c556
MNRFRTAIAVLLTVAVGGVTQAADPGPAGAVPSGRASEPANAPGWTGLTQPKAVITARQEIMEHAEMLMEPIDTITVKEVTNPDQLRSNAEAISAMLDAFPHLFPPTTNVYDPKVEQPETLALPAIWKNFDSFYQLAAAASKAAEAMGETHGKQQLRKASLALRASCDACHTLFLRPYVGPAFQESDYQFDFESALRQK